MADAIGVLFLAAEAEPYVKVGGLADVAGSLPLALRRLNARRWTDLRLDVRLVLPLHPTAKLETSQLKKVADFAVPSRNGSQPARLFQARLEGMPVYFVDGEPFATESSIYSSDPAVDRKKYAFFSLAVLELVRHLNWKVDLLHANDWHTALALYALRVRREQAGLQRVHSLLTVHNLPYMGSDGADVLAEYGLPALEEPGLPDWARTQPLPLGLWAAEAIVTVSPGYAGEILTPAFGCGLEGYLRQRGEAVSGVLNGLAESDWDPSTDRLLAKRFSSAEIVSRSANKAALQKHLGLPVDPFPPLLAMVGRVDQQKGVDLALEAFRRLADVPCQFVLLGSGDKALEIAALSLQVDFPDRARAVLRYDAALSRLIYAGADLFLMPSRYEPCGLAQMVAMRYGAVPVVRSTGGLRDTVRDGETGFLFEAAAVEPLVEAVRRALQAYAAPPRWREYQANGMKQDFSWTNAARHYAALYRSLARAPRR